jgi:hypothetical protein
VEVGNLKRIIINHFVLIITLISLFWVICYKLLWIKMGPIFFKAYEVGEIFYLIFGAILSSGIFYFIVIDLEKSRKNRYTKKIVIDKLNSISIRFKFLKLSISNEYINLPKEEDFYNNIEPIKIFDELIFSPISGINSKCWIDYLVAMRELDRKDILIFYSIIDYIDSDLFDLVTKLENNNLDVKISTIQFWSSLNSVNKPSSNATLKVIQKELFSYLTDLDNIDKYFRPLQIAKQK